MLYVFLKNRMFILLIIKYLKKMWVQICLLLGLLSGALIGGAFALGELVFDLPYLIPYYYAADQYSD
jgi:hypothetical protein